MTGRCGTYNGVNDHHRAGEPVCADCSDARAAYMRRYRLVRTWPSPLLEARPDLADLAAVGPVLATGALMCA